MAKARGAAGRALALDPRLAQALSALAYVRLHFDWAPDAAIRGFEHALTLNPSYTDGSLPVALSPNHARPAFHWGHYFRGWAWERLAEGRRIASQLREFAGGQALYAYEITLIHAALDEHHTAYESMKVAIRERSGWLAYRHVEPRMTLIRRDPRIASLLDGIDSAVSRPDVP